MMHSANDEYDDILIHLGKYERPTYSSGGEFKLHDTDYNVSKFLRRSHKLSHNWIANADKFTQLLNTKVYIDTSDPKYSHIYQGIDIIVNNVVSELSKLDRFFAEVNLRQTGSSMSEVKVGLPHEADYVIKFPKDKLLKSGKPFDITTLFTLVQQIIADQAVELTKGLTHWRVHGVMKYYKTGGVCLVMQCRATANDPASEEVGVTVDLIPGYTEQVIPEDVILNKKAKAFLPYSLEQYAEKEEIYRLINSYEYDTGFIENGIMKQLPEDTKRAYRVAKFLISHISLPLIPFEDIEVLDEGTRKRLYGHKPCVSSYTLRALFLHIVLNVHGTEAEQQLQGGLLAFCVLAMLEHCMESSILGDVFQIDHPLMTKCTLDIDTYSLQSIKKIMRFVETDNPTYIVNELCLLNNYDIDDDGNVIGPIYAHPQKCDST